MVCRQRNGTVCPGSGGQSMTFLLNMGRTVVYATDR
jgi:hypothetical protein